MITRLFLFFLLSLASSSAFSMSCQIWSISGGAYPDPSSLCAAWNAQKGKQGVVSFSSISGATTNYRCTDSSASTVLPCTGACPGGVVPSDQNNWSCEPPAPPTDTCPDGDNSGSPDDGKCYSCDGVACDTPPDDCSTMVGTNGLDMSGSATDGLCGCPAATPVLWSGACVAACASGESRNASGVCESNCPGDTQLVNGTCGCLAGYKVGVFNGQYTCQPSSATTSPPIGAPTISGGGTITDSSGQTTNVVVNADGSVTTTTTINNNTVVSGGGGVGGGSGSGAAGTATISNGTSTVSITRDPSGNIISQTGTSTNETKAPTLILPGILEKATPAPPSGIAGAFQNAPIVSALSAALGAFPTGGQCSTIALNLNLPMGKVININMDKQCTMFSEIAPYLTMFAMVIYGLMSYRIFLRSASGV